MARSIFSITQSIYSPGESLTFYDRSSGGARVTDLFYSSSGLPGDSIPNGIVAITPTGSALSILGPEGVTTLYVEKRSDRSRAATYGTTDLLDYGTVLSGSSVPTGAVFTYRGQQVMANQPITGLTGSAPFISASKYVVLGDGDDSVIPAKRFGYKASGSDTDATTNSTALQAANDYLNALGGGIIQLPIGNGRFNGNLILDQGVILRGTGFLGSVLQAAVGSNYDYLVGNRVASDSSGKNAEMCGLINICLDGRKDNQSSGDGHGVRFKTNPLTSAASQDSFFDPHHVLQNVRVYKAYGDGFHLEGRSALQGNILFAQTCGGWGFWSTFDTNIGYAEADGCALGGFHFNNGSQRIAVAKAFVCGKNTGTQVPGFYFGSNSYSVTIAAAEAQNNTGPGYHLDNCKAITIQGAAESNWINDAGTGAGTAGPGFLLDGATNCTITGSCTQGKQNSVQVGNQLYAVKLTGGADANSIQVSNIGVQGASVTGAATGDTTLLANRLVVNGVQINP